MKTAIYIEDGVVQLVLTPESDFERDALKSFEDKPLQTVIRVGAFYDCNGGWTRWKRTSGIDAYANHEDRSLILRIANAKPE